MYKSLTLTLFLVSSPLMKEDRLFKKRSAAEPEFWRLRIKHITHCSRTLFRDLFGTNLPYLLQLEDLSDPRDGIIDFFSGRKDLSASRAQRKSPVPEFVHPDFVLQAMKKQTLIE